MNIEERKQNQKEIHQKLDKINALNQRINQNYSKLDFALTYQEGLWKEPKFWLGGIPKRKLGPEFEKYLKCHRAAFGHAPSWVEEVPGSKAYNLDSFYGQMKLMWKKNNQ